MSKDLATQFQEALLEHCRKAAELGVRSPRLEKSIAQRGGAEALRDNLRRSRVSDLFSGLAKLNRLDLCPEALVVQGKFGPLFTDEEADFCLSVLCEAGYYRL